jgi:heat-inducible transcriptional repressor
MARLEDLDLLRKPHTSSGRVPTEKGYRVYVDRVVRPKPLTGPDARSIRKAMAGAYSLEDVLEQVCRNLEMLSGQAGIAVLPGTTEGSITRLETVRVGRRGMLIRLAIEPGGMRTVALRLASSEEREMASRLLGKLARGLLGKGARQAADALRKRSGPESGSRSLSASIRVQLIRVLEEAAGSVRVTGTGNLVSAMSDTSQAGSLLEVLESRDTVTRLMLSDEDESGATVRIGSENGYPPMRLCSIIRSTYRIGDRMGAIGIVGPLRMEYSRLIGLVEFASSELDRFLAE